jgi:phosphoribosylaminoimidazole-succinocarboxamide synthase
MRVRRVRVIYNQCEISKETTNYLIPLECIIRYYVHGSLWDRVASGKFKAARLGFPKGHVVSLGEKLPRPLFEVTTKLEKFDRNLTFAEALSISGLTKGELTRIKNLALRIDQHMHAQIEPRGLIHVDGKKEFAFDEGRRLMVVDTFGTADEDRFWSMEDYKRGIYVERSKEFVRQYYRKMGYYDRLMRAREAGVEEPPIPPLPREVIDRVSELYILLFEDLTGRRFR